MNFVLLLISSYKCSHMILLVNALNNYIIKLKMSNKFLNQTFTTQQSYVNLSQVGPRIIKHLLEPLQAKLSEDKDYNGQAKIQYYIKFSNQIILKVFLSYLCNKKFPFSKPTDSEEDSIELIIEKLNHLKEYYKANKKQLQAMKPDSLDEAIYGIGNSYLYLDDVNERNYKELQIDEDDQNHIALAVLRYNKNIILAVLKRVPAQRKQQKPNKKPNQPKTSLFSSAGILKLAGGIASIVSLLIIILVLYLIYKYCYPVPPTYGPLQHFGYATA